MILFVMEQYSIIDVTVLIMIPAPWLRQPHILEMMHLKIKIIITFNREMDVDTFNNHTVILENDIGSPIPVISENHL